eukprot:scaffold77814_cov67-Phaeocystis_antarctica.AAC.4
MEPASEADVKDVHDIVLAVDGEGAPLRRVDTDAQQTAEARLAQLPTRRAVPREHLHALAALLGH